MRGQEKMMRRQRGEWWDRGNEGKREGDLVQGEMRGKGEGDGGTRGNEGKREL